MLLLNSSSFYRDDFRGRVMNATESATDLFDGSEPTAEVIERRLYWLVGWHMPRRRSQIALRLGVHRNTLSYYCDSTVQRAANRPKAGRKLGTLIGIIGALDLDLASVMHAAAAARTETEMVELARVRTRLPDEAQPKAAGVGALPA